MKRSKTALSFFQIRVKGGMRERERVGGGGSLACSRVRGDSSYLPSSVEGSCFSRRDFLRSVGDELDNFYINVKHHINSSVY